MIKVVIDASNIGIGGGHTHLFELVNFYSNNEEWKKRISLIIVAREELQAKLGKTTEVEYITHILLEKGILERQIFRLFYLTTILNNIYILFSITGDYSGSFRPYVGMVRNMLFYDNEQWKKRGFFLWI